MTEITHDIRFAPMLVAILVAAVTAGGCASGDETPSADRPSPTPAVTTEASATPSPRAAEEDAIELEVWLASEAGLFPVSRSVERTSAVGRAAIESLLEGATSIESASGIFSAVPAETELIGLDISAGAARVDLSAGFGSGGGTHSIRTRVAQIVFTLTQFPTVREVEFLVDGEPADVFSSEGLLLEEPQRRKAYRDLLPPIIVTEPAIGDRVTSPLTVSGTANVFEATVSMRLVVDGATVAESFATATCGTGCRGTYTHELGFSVTEPTEGLLEVFESSAEDGSPLHVVSIPVRLLP